MTCLQVPGYVTWGFEFSGGVRAVRCCQLAGRVMGCFLVFRLPGKLVFLILCYKTAKA